MVATHPRTAPLATRSTHMVDDVGRPEESAASVARYNPRHPLCLSSHQCYLLSTPPLARRGTPMSPTSRPLRHLVAIALSTVLMVFTASPVAMAHQASADPAAAPIKETSCVEPDVVRSLNAEEQASWTAAIAEAAMVKSADVPEDLTPVRGQILDSQSEDSIIALELTSGSRRFAAYHFGNVGESSSGAIRVVDLGTPLAVAQPMVVLDTRDAAVVPNGGTGCLRWNVPCLKRVFSSGCAHGGCAFMYWNAPLTALCLLGTCGTRVWNCCSKFATPDPWAPDSGAPVLALKGAAS